LGKKKEKRKASRAHRIDIYNSLERKRLDIYIQLSTVVHFEKEGGGKRKERRERRKETERKKEAATSCDRHSSLLSVKRARRRKKEGEGEDTLVNALLPKRRAGRGNPTRFKRRGKRKKKREGKKRAA